MTPYCKGLNRHPDDMLGVRKQLRSRVSSMSFMVTRSRKNQIEGTTTKNRWIITKGNLSVRCRAC